MVVNNAAFAGLARAAAPDTEGNAPLRGLSGGMPEREADVPRELLPPDEASGGSMPPRWRAVADVPNCVRAAGAAAAGRPSRMFPP